MDNNHNATLHTPATSTDNFYDNKELGDSGEFFWRPTKITQASTLAPPWRPSRTQPITLAPTLFLRIDFCVLHIHRHKDFGLKLEDLVPKLRATHARPNEIDLVVVDMRTAGPVQLTPARTTIRHGQRQARLRGAELNECDEDASFSGPCTFCSRTWKQG